MANSIFDSIKEGINVTANAVKSTTENNKTTIISEESDNSPYKLLDNFQRNILLDNNLPTGRNSIRYYDRFSKFGVLDPYNKLTYCKQYLFFTKPDLNIVNPGTGTLQPVFANDSFFNDLLNRQPDVIGQLQKSAGICEPFTESEIKSPFMNLLSNSVTNTLDLQGLSASTMDTPANMWGGFMNYRKDAWAGDEQIEFSLEFEDTKHLDIYYLLKAYEIYHRYTIAGYIYPPNISKAKEVNGNYYDSYTKKKQQHDVFGIYKFIVDDDYTRLLYWAYVCGAYFVNVPRDAFNGMNGSAEGLKFTVDFKAFCADDMDPLILSDFNNIVVSAYGNKHSPHDIVKIKDAAGLDRSEISNDTYDVMNGKWPRYPLITRRLNDNHTDHPLGVADSMKYVYELHWYD